MLNKRPGKTTPLWTPGHHGIAGDEEADACAKQAAAINDGAPRPVSFAKASALIRPTLNDPRLATAEQRRSAPKNFRGRPTVGLSPRGATLFSSPVYEPDHANQLDTSVDPKCLSCGEEPQTVEHWLCRHDVACEGRACSLNEVTLIGHRGLMHKRAHTKG